MLLLRARHHASPSLAFSRPWVRAISSSPPLIRIRNATFYEQYPTSPNTKSSNGRNPPLFTDLSFTLPSGTSTPSESDPNDTLQHWAIVGSSGRAELLHILRGQYVCVPPAARSYPLLLTDEIAAKDLRLRFPGNAIQYIGFSGEGSGPIGGTRDAYLGARYESLREETDWTVQQYLRGQTSLNPSEEEARGTVRNEQLFSQVIGDLRLNDLLDMPGANLSNGQTRRARIAKAILNQPELLLIDEPFMGLDPATVNGVSSVLYQLARKCSPRLILALRPQDPLPDWITHLMILGNSYKVLIQGDKLEVQEKIKSWRYLFDKTGSRPPSTVTEDPLYHQGKANMENGFLDRQLLRDLGLVSLDHAPIQLLVPRGKEPVIEMNGVQVQYGDRIVLGNWRQYVDGKPAPGLHWKVRRGQRWAVLGANGSGKTTLLSLITSDHPQTYALPVKLFGRSRLPEPGKPAISIFELQSRIGHSSPEIHAIFPRHLSIRQAVESAFADSFLARPKLDYERDQDVNAVLNFFKADLDPSIDVSDPEDTASSSPTDALFTLPRIAGRGRRGTPKLDNAPEFADSIQFGELSMAQQRLVLFIRTLVHKPDIVILDEAFSGMAPGLRDKCLHFLEAGETNRKYTTGTRRASMEDTWFLKPAVSAKPAEMRFYGLSDEQALIVVSHVKEEIPDSVRYFMRLPSDPGDGSESLDFRCGVLKYGSSLNGGKWDLVWLPPSKMKPHVSRAWRKSGENDSGEEKRDENVYQYVTL